MTREQAERKAMELYPDADSRADFYHGYQRETELERAAFMQCFDLMPTGSLPAMRWVKANEIANGVHCGRCISKISGTVMKGAALVHEKKVTVFTPLGGDRPDVNDPDCLFEILDDSAAPAPVGVTREDAAQEYAKKYGTLGHRETARKAFIAGTHFTAPVSSAAQPATGYTEERGHSTNPNVQEKASIQPPLSAPEWINKHNSGG